jgi:hypothetical protein
VRKEAAAVVTTTGCFIKKICEWNADQQPLQLTLKVITILLFVT